MKTNRTLAEWLEDYNEYRTVYQISMIDNRSIKTFINWCQTHHPEQPYLTQEILDEWGPKREHETNRTHVSRISGVNRLLRFMNDRGTSFKLIDHERVEPTDEPRSITEEEIRNLFRAADELKTVSPRNKHYLRYMTRALQMPVMLRLMYSSGLRPPEVRLLNIENHDFNNGLLYIKAGKGYNERLVPLDPDMNKLLKLYDLKMDKIMPNRIPMFPNEKGDYRSANNFRENWRIVCDKYNSTATPTNKKNLVPYGLRHYHITTNINKLPHDGWLENIRLVAISRYAGHSDTATTTKYYYHLTERSIDLINLKMNELFDDLI